MILSAQNRVLKIKILLAVFLAVNIAFWFLVRDRESEWGNVPPPPSKGFAAAYGLGDEAFAYRVNGVMLQNMGDVGGRFTPLHLYDYDRLARWFFLQDSLDPQSEYMPHVASYYYASLQKPEKYRPVLEYLKTVGLRHDAEKWRWLAQAVYIARFMMNDLDTALELANVLADSHADLPPWVTKMPVRIVNAQGNKEGAYEMMLAILQANKDTMHPSELNQTRFYICHQILEPAKARDNPLCYDQDIE